MLPLSIVQLERPVSKKWTVGKGHERQQVLASDCLGTGQKTICRALLAAMLANQSSGKAVLPAVFTASMPLTQKAPCATYPLGAGTLQHHSSC